MEPLDDVVSAASESDAHHHYYYLAPNAPSFTAAAPPVGRLPVQVPTSNDLYGSDPSPAGSSSATHPQPSGSRLSSSSQPTDLAAAHEEVESRTADFRSRIVEIERVLRGAGKGLQAKDKTIHRLETEVEALQQQCSKLQSSSSAKGLPPPPAPREATRHHWEREPHRVAFAARRELAAEEADVAQDGLYQKNKPSLPRGGVTAAYHDASSGIRWEGRRASPKGDGGSLGRRRRGKEAYQAASLPVSSPSLDAPPRRGRDTEAVKDSQSQQQQQQQVADRLAAQVSVLQKTVRRLLTLLGEVPGVKEYLDLHTDGNMDCVFLGHEGGGSRHVKGRRHSPMSASSTPGSKQRMMKGPPSPRSPWDGGEAVGRRVPQLGDDELPAAATGVASGVWGGTTSAQDSKNVWLNGRWLERLQRVLFDNDGMLWETLSSGVGDEGVRCPHSLSSSALVPSPSSSGDVLLARNPQRDYWVPLSIFKLSQVFKDEHCPSVSMKCFYPYLQEMSTVWGEQLKKKLKPLHEQQQRHEKQISGYAKELEESRDAIQKLKLKLHHQHDVLSADAIRKVKAALVRASSPHTIVPQARGRSLSAAWSHQRAVGHGNPHRHQGERGSIRSIYAALEALRQKLRLQVISPSALQIARQYESILQQLLPLASSELDDEEVDEDVDDDDDDVVPYPHDTYSSTGPSFVRHPAAAAATRANTGSRMEYESEYESYESSSHDDGYHRVKPTQHTARRETVPYYDGEDGGDGSANPIIERLLCVVQHTCDELVEGEQELVGQVGATTRDMNRFLVSLRQRLQDGEELPTSPGLSPIVSKHGNGGGLLQPTRYSEDGAQHTTAGSQATILLRVIESVLDYGNEVMASVGDAGNRWRKLAQVAIHEARKSIHDEEES